MSGLPKPIMNEKDKDNNDYEYQLNIRTQKAKMKYSKILFFLGTMMILSIINVILYFYAYNIFGTYLNLFSILYCVIAALITFFIAKKGFNIIDSRIVDKNRKLYLINSMNMIIYLINVLYLVLKNVFFNLEQVLFFKDRNVFLYGCTLIITIIYFTANSCIQVMIVFKFKSCSKLFNKLEKEKSFTKIEIGNSE